MAPEGSLRVHKNPSSPSYEAPRYTVFSYLLPLHISSVQIFTSANFCQTPSVYIPPLTSETKFCKTNSTTGNISFIYSNVLRF
jgi:hypothetical protein